MSDVSRLAPVLLFVFARPDHTKMALDALAANVLASQSDLIVFADAASNHSDVAAVEEVRRLVKESEGFRSLTLVEREINYGLARNIIEGVTEMCRRYDRVIVLEDDLVTSPGFLSFMNHALERYAHDERVWHVSGWNYPISSDGFGDAFFLRVMNCWGWGTWADRWRYFEKNTEKLLQEFDCEMIKEFDLDRSGVFWSQVLANKKKQIDTWAVYWYATIFKNKGLCLNPAISYVSNIGLDGSGIHRCQNRDQYSSALNSNLKLRLPDVIEENIVAINRICDFYHNLKPTLFQRFYVKLTSFFKK